MTVALIRMMAAHPLALLSVVMAQSRARKSVMKETQSLLMDAPHYVLLMMFVETTLSIHLRNVTMVPGTQMMVAQPTVPLSVVMAQ